MGQPRLSAVMLTPGSSPRSSFGDCVPRDLEVLWGRGLADCARGLCCAAEVCRRCSIRTLVRLRGLRASDLAATKKVAVMNAVDWKVAERLQTDPFLFGGTCGWKASLPEESWNRSRGSR